MEIQISDEMDPETIPDVSQHIPKGMPVTNHYIHHNVNHYYAMRRQGGDDGGEFFDRDPCEDVDIPRGGFYEPGPTRVYDHLFERGDQRIKN